MDTGCDAQTSSQDPSDSPSASVNRRVLIVDDSLSIHEDFHKILMPSQNLALSQVEDQLFGSVPPRPLQVFSLDSAFQGREALAMVESALARDTPYAMAFIDMRMPPGWDGLETIEQLWKVDPDLQIALCTAYSDYSWETMAERLAFGDQLLILKKPFDSLEIRQMASALTWKWQMTQDARHKLDDLQRTIEERVAELLKVSHLLHYDTLTGLPSSALLGDRLGQAMARARRYGQQLAVMFLGLDRFKRINNALGYPAGDELLKRIAHSLQHGMRESDSVFRYGSDEFVVLLHDQEPPPQVRSVAEKLLATVSQPHDVAGHDLRVTASLGISLYPEDGQDALSLIKKAEMAMRNSKEQAPGGYGFFTEDMTHRARERQHLESGIRQALERQELSLHYQPKIHLASGQVVGAEALIRWFSPQQGWISPAQFIPVAEDSGLINRISQWVVGEATRQSRAWQQAGLAPIRLSVNLSASDFRQPQLLQQLQRALLDSALDPTLLELEITEGVLMQNVEATLATLQAIKALGVRLAVDDFGTGYSSLSYLRKFPVDVLKIDQSFIHGLSHEPKDAALVSAIIQLGRSLNLSIIAEGVETQEQLAFLKQQGCEEGQGYYFSKALPADSFARLLRAQASQKQVADHDR
ncbi:MULTISPECIES: putative bifunctional diguanylate cyclase/phosphodiesterase [Pseudomonas]|uniref:cyclic-guanylate-specific phosphodiesterase n=2 Tax=Pseudomonas TaxID=286 RepID=A0A9Q6N9D2_9PSED|nr:MULTISPECIES: EAL domain-containing protein [Pseudomonas]MBW8354374.1 EAL domain-containing protein [Pseudomonas sp.]MCY7259370.1 EAL domain-containing protein [Pseudomonas protegens]MDD1147639.1 EAL domain-containing protein [Pseudomonas idahonensis]MDP9504917.1 EAL domain-containing protein [Pseudomonas protegens]MDP9510159.1 EAL domain-containing protein [Pseudomonas protegens]